MYCASTNRKLQRRITAVAFAILLATPSEAETGAAKLVVSLDVSAVADHDNVDTAVALVQEVLGERGDWFSLTESTGAADIRVALSHETDAASSYGLWRVTLAPDPDGGIAELPENSRAFPRVDSIKPFLRIDLARLYITKNLRQLRSYDVPVELRLAGQTEGVPILYAGDTMSFVFSTRQDGYLNLINVDPLGNVTLLYPPPEKSNQVQASAPLTVPPAGTVFRVGEPFGPEYVKAIFSTVPLDLSFLSEQEDAGESLDDLLVRIELTRGGRLQIGTSDLHFVTRER